MELIALLVRLKLMNYLRMIYLSMYEGISILKMLNFKYYYSRFLVNAI